MFSHRLARHSHPLHNCPPPLHPGPSYHPSRCPQSGPQQLQWSALQSHSHLPPGSPPRLRFNTNTSLTYPARLFDSGLARLQSTVKFLTRDSIYLLKDGFKLSFRVYEMGFPCFNHSNLKRPKVFLDEGIWLKVSPNSWLNLTRFRTAGPWLLSGAMTHARTHAHAHTHTRTHARANAHTHIHIRTHLNSDFMTEIMQTWSNYFRRSPSCFWAGRGMFPYPITEREGWWSRLSKTDFHLLILCCGFRYSLNRWHSFNWAANKPLLERKKKWGKAKYCTVCLLTTSVCKKRF